MRSSTAPASRRLIFFVPIQITGLSGRTLEETWRNGAEAYLGITVSGFPNFFLLYGPNTNVSGSVIYMLERQARYIVDCIRALGLTGACFMDVLESVQSAYNDGVQRRLGASVQTHVGCRSYFRVGSFGKVTTNWPGYMLEYGLKTLRPRKSDYNFVGE
jgi:hypothetical protein